MVMKMRKNKNRKPVSAIYAFGLVWLLYSIFFRLSGFGSLIKCLLLAWAVSALVKNLTKKEKNVEEEPVRRAPKKDPVVQEPVPSENKQKPPVEPAEDPIPATGNPELDSVILQGRKYVKRIQELNDDIPDFKVSAQLKQIEILTASIIDQVEKKENQLRQVKQFINYYLPTTIKLLEQYVQLQNIGMKGENIAGGMQQIEELLDKVIVAFQKQLDSLFERDLVDITADIQVMEQMMAAQGLTNEKDF